jgi:hypothetical protein
VCTVFIENTGCPKNGVLMVHYGVEEITVNVKKMLKKFYWTYLLIWRSLKVALNRSIIGTPYTYIFFYLLIFFILLLSTVYCMQFLIKIQIKQLLDNKKEYFSQKIEITPKGLEIGIHNVNKSGLKIKFYIYICCQKW